MSLHVPHHGGGAPPPGRPGSVALSTGHGRWLLFAAVLASGLASIDATVVNIALPAIGRDLHAPFSALQWTVSGYTLTLASLILLGGAAGDRYGRRRMLLVGVVGFALASAGCAAAPGATTLVAFRVVQGAAAALLTPASLALIQSTFRPQDRSRAVGAWAGLSGIAAGVAPFIGGWLLGLGSWRWVFLINPPLAVLLVAVIVRHVPESRDEQAQGRLDLSGSVLALLGLGLTTYAAIAAGDPGTSALGTAGWLAAGVLVLGLFIGWERRARRPLLPLELFRSRQFTGANLVTFAVYASLNGYLFLLIIELQVVAGFSPLVAGSALLPLTVFTLLLSERSGQLAQRLGPRLQMTTGPLVCAAAAALTLRLGPHASYTHDVLPALSLFGIGLAIMVAPLTTAVLAAAPDAHAGIASGVNNAVARAAGLLAVAALPALVGLTGATYTDAAAFLPPFRAAVVVCIAGFVLGAALAAGTMQRPTQGGSQATQAGASLRRGG
ncbi:MFS transporter [Phycicoccus ginsengisoli]